MAARTYRRFSPFERTPPSRRAIGFVLAIALNLLVLLALLGIGGIRPVAMKDDGGTLIFDVARQDQAAAPSPETERQRPKQQQRERPVVRPPEIVLPVKPTITPPPEATLDLIELTREEQSTTDRAMAESSPAVPSAGSGRGGDSAVVGKGARGETLYRVEWLREPTSTELSAYLPSSASGYGIIACKTYPGFRVDDCYALESNPATSYLARAVVKAAWQFKVRPPRKNGVPVIGESVTIRIDWNRKE